MSTTILVHSSTRDMWLSRPVCSAADMGRATGRSALHRQRSDGTRVERRVLTRRDRGRRSAAPGAGGVGGPSCAATRDSGRRTPPGRLGRVRRDCLLDYGHLRRRRRVVVHRHRLGGVQAHWSSTRPDAATRSGSRPTKTTSTARSATTSAQPQLSVPDVRIALSLSSSPGQTREKRRNG